MGGRRARRPAPARRPRAARRERAAERPAPGRAARAREPHRHRATAGCAGGRDAGARRARRASQPSTAALFELRHRNARPPGAPQGAATTSPPRSGRPRLLAAACWPRSSRTAWRCWPRTSCAPPSLPAAFPDARSRVRGQLVQSVSGAAAVARLPVPPRRRPRPGARRRPEPARAHAGHAWPRCAPPTCAPTTPPPTAPT